MGSLEMPERVGPCTTKDAEGCVWSFYYVNLKEIGRGGFGVVFLAERYYFEPRPGTDGRKYAIKVLKQPTSGDRAASLELRRRIVMEKRVHERLNAAGASAGDHVVTPISFLKMSDPSGSPDSLDLIVTEFCEGGDLLSHLKRLPEPMNEDQVRNVARQVVKGLLAIHRAGFIHRDVKEANIFISYKKGVPVYKLGDFGLAADAGEINTLVCGTERFMAPEMDGRTAYGASVDVWSLGILIHTLLGSIISPEAKDLLGKMLVRDPAKRAGLADVQVHPFVTGQPSFNLTKDSGLASSLGSSLNTPRHFVPGLKKVEESGYSGRSLNSGPARSLTVDLMPAFSTARLRPSSKKHQFKVGAGSIQPDGSVKLEFNITKKMMMVTVQVLETMVVSGDGLTVTINRDSQVKSYSHSNLPTKYWPKYNYAAKFVNIVRESTPKITFYTDKAMCRLMENGPPDANFETHFYTGLKFCYSSQKGVSVTDKNRGGVGEQFPANTVSLDRSHPHFEEWQEFQRCRERAKRLELQFEAIRSDKDKDPFFPVTLGKRPSSLSTVPSSSSIGDLRSNNYVVAATRDLNQSPYIFRTISSPGPLSHNNIL